MRGFVLSVGDELLSGLAVDTNSAWLSEKLRACGWSVMGHVTVGDDQAAIEDAIGAASAKADVVIVTGGIGPTPDDLTREALAAVLKVPLIEFEPWTRHMEAFFQERGRVMHRANRKQALIPRGGKIICNAIGTAAGIDADHPRFDRSSQEPGGAFCKIVALPGVPAEMKAMFQEHVMPWARQKVVQAGGRAMRALSLHTFGGGESDLAARLGDLLRRRHESEGLQVGTTASGGVVSIRAYAAGSTEAEAQAKLAAIETEARQKLGELIFGRDHETLAEVVGRLLREHPRRPVVRVAESCTGGLLGKLITDVAGSSDYFDRGFITYSNEAKVEMLGVPAELMAAHGAVSEEVVKAMATGALPAGRLPEGRGAIALSISGVAGPAGGTAEKPIGMVCIGLATHGLDQATALVGARDTAKSRADAADAPAGQRFAMARTFRFVGDRDLIRHRSAMMALAMLRYHLLGVQMPF